MHARSLVAMLLVALMLLGATGASKDKSPRPDKAKPGVGKKDATSVQVSVLFSKHDRDIITGWVGDRHSSLPPGLAKKGQLPPGLQKQLVRNGTLPPGLEKKVHPLPVELEGRLPRLPADYRRVAIDGSVFIMNRNTRVIADVLLDFAP